MAFTFNAKETKVALLCGGKSGEREISLASGNGAKEALLEAGFQVEMIDPSNKQDLIKLVEEDFDVAFLTLHGKYGEDGTVQGMLEILDIPYTGPGVWSSATAIDKPKAKVYYEKNGILTPKSLTLTSPFEKNSDEIAEEIGEHCVVKAATEGSALGVYICHNKKEIKSALKAVFEIDTQALVEAFISGDEFTVAVLGNEEPQALPVIRIIPVNEFYDFESKYSTGGSQHICPAPLPEELTQKAKDIAISAHKALECTGVSRTDLILDEKGDFWALETNTIPGMTATSLLPDAARAAGYSFSELCCQLIQYAFETHEKRKAE